MSNHIIEQERQGLWIAATFVLALLALVLSFVSISRNNELAVGTQVEILGLHKRITTLQHGGEQAPAAAPAPATAPAK
jgi:hypothetical protein